MEGGEKTRSCSLYTLTSWIEAHDIHEVARNYHVNESPMKHHPWNFPGKYHDGGELLKKTRMLD